MAEANLIMLHELPRHLNTYYTREIVDPLSPSQVSCSICMRTYGTVDHPYHPTERPCQAL